MFSDLGLYFKVTKFPLLFNVVLEVLARATGQEKEIKGLQIEVKYLSFQIPLEPINEFGKVLRDKINV